MAQISIAIKYILNKNERDVVGSVKAKIDTSARVDDFLDALKDSVKDLAKTKMQLYLPVNPNESLDDFGIQESATIVIVANSTGPIVVIENDPKK